jgi:uncharacterized protein (TIGR02246 family)
MIRIIAAAAALAVAGQAFAADLTPEQIIQRHIEAGNRGDPAAMAADYADNAMVLQAGTSVQGRAAIQAMFARLFGSGAQQKVTITPVKVWSEGDVGYVSWTANGGAIKGTDDFLVRGGKILVQAVYIGAGPPPAAQ